MIQKRFFLSEIIVILTVLFVYNNLMYKKEVVINADGRGYYEYLPALFIYEDIHFDYLDTLETDYYDIEVMSQFYKNSKFEHNINKYFSGTALLQSPFFALSHYYAKSSKGKFKADGFSKPYQRGVLYAAIFYLFLGLVFIRKLLETYGLKWWWIFILQLSIIYCTSLFTYSMYDSAYSHVYSFAMISGFLFVVRKYFLNQKSHYILLAFLFFGLITILRPVNILVILFIPFLADSLNVMQLRLKRLFILNWKSLVIGAFIYLIVLCVQFYISYLQTGNPLSYSYGDEGFNFLSPRFFDFLFSYHKGFFLWSPWWFLTFILGAVFWLRSKSYYHLISFSSAFIIIVYVVSSWWAWTYGGSHGSRPMVDFYGAFVLLAIPIYTSAKQYLFVLIAIITIPLAVVNLIQSNQYQKAIIHWDGMTKERYWKVFLNTNDKYTWYFWREQLVIGEKQSEIILFENKVVNPTDSYLVKAVNVVSIDSLSIYGQFVFDIEREAENEYFEILFSDSDNKVVWSEYKQLFRNQSGTQVVCRFQLPENKLDFEWVALKFYNIKDPLKINRATFSTHYSLF